MMHLGEAFDKTAKILGIEFPGGPKIETLCKIWKWQT
jgi:N6-L-threonylcarbamoyladenine synthase